MIRKISLFALALLSLSAPLGASVIYVSGDQTGTWSADTVIVTAEVRVPPGQSLTIQPGVEVLFQACCKFIVDNGATLTAVGTLTDSIRFDEYWPGNWWKGIRFLSASSTSELAYCHLKHGAATVSAPDYYGGAIYCSSSNPTIQNCLIDSCTASYGGGIYCSTSSPTIIANTISGNSTGSANGGGIYCTTNSNPIISGNTISGNSVTGNFVSGGGIHCEFSSPIISGNTISSNSANGGGGIYCSHASPGIIGNTILANTASAYGGGICCQWYSNPNIIGNTISGNSASGGFEPGNGGGIYCWNRSNPSISDNTIIANSASGYGGGICCYYYCRPMISGNTINGNSAYSNGGGIFFNNNPEFTISGNTLCANSASYGGGIYCLNVYSLNINKCTIAANSATTGGGLYCTGSSASLINSIHCANFPPKIYQTSGSNVLATYCDIQQLWPGIGNINAWPAFVDTAQGDYRLHWDSPCIDTGDPNPIYNDPDGSRADMGAWYYDQSLPVRVLLTPYNTPIQIPPEGGSFQYAIQATNIADSALITSLWCNLTLPNGTTFGPVLGPVRVSLGSEQTISRVRTQNISGHAPAGMYHYNAYAVAEGDTSEDSFTFTKLGAGNWGLGAGDWTNMGEEFESPSLTTDSKELRTYNLELRTAPNPFNPTTAIHFELRDASYVNLKVYDMAGRLVIELVHGWRDVGAHEVTFDGSQLPSGIYFAKLKAGGYSQVQKLVLLK